MRTRFLYGLSIKSILASRLAFCVAIALLMALLRLLIFDYPVYFNMQYVPNHDMYQGAPFFATSMHSIRLSGEIAWWNPVSNNGYAQYYQSFFSPLAPTSNHIVFILWAQVVRLLSFLKFHIPEYFQFLTITYIIFPFLAFLSFSLFASLIFRHRATIFLMLVVYTFSGIGLWNSAWFFFQEPFTLFLFLAAAIAVLQKPTARRLLWLLAALLIQLTSFNYWTVYNSWFITIMLGAYCWTHTNQLRRLFVRTREVIRRHKLWAGVVCVMSACVVVVWFVIIGSIAIEQSGNYVGAFASNSGVYSTAEAFDRVQEMRRFTTELFNPDVQRPLHSYKILNEIHNARYIGAFLLPLLLLLPVYSWRRRERWLIASAVLVLIICLAPPFLLSAWKAVPFMDRVRHLFYFYTQYWQLLVVLLAGCGMDMLLQRAYGAALRRRFLFVVSGLAALMLLLFIGYLSFSHLFPAGDHTLQANVRFALLALIASVIIIQMLLFPTKKNLQLFVLIICALALTDLTRYFWEASRADKSFTETRWPASSPLSPEVKAALQKPWDKPDMRYGFKSDLYRNMPVANLFWTENIYMDHRYVLELRQLPAEFQQHELQGQALDFYTRAASAPGLEQISEALKNNPALFINNQLLLIQSDANEKLPRVEDFSGQPFTPPSNTGQPGTSEAAASGFTYQWREWRYNDFAFEVNAPLDGWLLIRQIDDPLWRLTVDGKPVRPARANVVGMALPLSEGRHIIEMDYRPLARRLYRVGSLLLELTLLILIITSFIKITGRPLRHS
ncbi:MAG TPA: hypothetical protein VGC66_00180 [Pyrinomonadaceae bacterium]